MIFFQVTKLTAPHTIAPITSTPHPNLARQTSRQPRHPWLITSRQPVGSMQPPHPQLAAQHQSNGENSSLRSPGSRSSRVMRSSFSALIQLSIAATTLFNQFDDIIDRHRPFVGPVDCNHRSLTARREAFDLQQRE